MRLKVTSDGDIVSNEYEPTMQDVSDYSFGMKTEGSERWSGHVRDTIGLQCQNETGLAFSIPLEHIPDEAHNKPDYVNTEHRVVVEVYAGTEIGDIDRASTCRTGIPHRSAKPYDVRKHLMEALRHAKDKMNPDTDEYLSRVHGIDGDYTYLAMYVMEFQVYSSLTKEMMIDIYSGCDLGDYLVDGIVVYWHPVGLGDECYGGDVFVLYRDESRIDRGIFGSHTEFIRLPDRCGNRPDTRRTGPRRGREVQPR